MAKKKLYDENGNVVKGAKVKKPFYKKIWFWLLILIVGAIAMSGGDEEVDDQNTEPEQTEVAAETDTTEEAENETSEEAEEEGEPEDDVPTEYKSALNSAKSYSDMMYMSKKGIFDQLTSEYGDKFPEEAAQYAVDNLETDYNRNALKSAENYSDMMYMSKAGVYDQLISDHGDKFTAEEAQYAIDNIDADWKENALKSAQNYQETMDMSIEAIRSQLTSDHGEQFTQEEADYAIENLE